MVPLAECPPIALHARAGVFLAARATYYAPSEDTGAGGMHHELMRCNPRWYGTHARYDTVLVNINPEVQALNGGMMVARVRLFFQFKYEESVHSCAFVEWFSFCDEAPDEATGMWCVEPEMIDGRRVVGVISLDSIVRACHLMPVFGTTRLPVDFRFSDSLDAFRMYYINRYIDYHAYETVV